jgi:hypothetical protein
VGKYPTILINRRRIAPFAFRQPTFHIERRNTPMKKSILLSAVASTLFAFSVAATAAPAPAPIGTNAPAGQTNAPDAGPFNGMAPAGNNGYAATPAQPNGAGVPATPAVPGNPIAAQETRLHRPEMGGLSGNHPDIQAPDVERPTIERPTVERPAIERPTIERPTIERPTIERPTIERPTVERPDVQVPSFPH